MNEPTLTVQMNTLSVNPMLEVQPTAYDNVSDDFSHDSSVKEISVEFSGDTVNKVGCSTSGCHPFPCGRGVGKTFPLLGSDEELDLEMCDLHVAVGINSLNHNASTEISNTVLGKGGNEFLPISLAASQAIGTSGSNADPSFVDFGLIFKDLLHDETN